MLLKYRNEITTLYGDKTIVDSFTIFLLLEPIMANLISVFKVHLSGIVLMIM